VLSASSTCAKDTSPLSLILSVTGILAPSLPEKLDSESTPSAALIVLPPWI
jgi:hypothetical protein